MAGDYGAALALGNGASLPFLQADGGPKNASGFVVKLDPSVRG